MFFHCVGCFKNKYLKFYLCEECLLSLESSYTDDANLFSIYSYSSLIRELIIRAKVHRDLRALETIKKLVLSSQKIKRIAKGMDLIIPAPSNMMSRLKGKIDIAWVLADAIAKDVGKELHSPPRSTLWRMRKQAKKKNRDQIILQLPQNLSGKKILLVDDVITSGETMQSLANHYTDHQVTILTFASARDSDLSI